MKNWRIMKQQTLNVGIKGVLNHKKEDHENIDKVIEEKSDMNFDGNMIGQLSKVSGSSKKGSIKKAHNPKKLETNGSIIECDEDKSSCENDSENELEQNYEEYEPPTM